MARENHGLRVDSRWTAIRGEAKRDAGTIFVPVEDLGERRRQQWPAVGRGAWHTSQQSYSLKLGEKSHCPRKMLE